jgi:hypothetical protein
MDLSFWHSVNEPRHNSPSFGLRMSAVSVFHKSPSMFTLFMVTLFNFLRPPAFTPGYISRVPLFVIVKLVCASKKLSNEKKRTLKKMIVIVAKEKLGVFNLAENGTIYGYQK